MAVRVDWKRWPARWVMGSLLVHALLLGVGASRHHRQVAVAPRAAPTQADAQLEVEVEASPAVTDAGGVAVPTTRAAARAHSGTAVLHSSAQAVAEAEVATGDDATEAAHDAAEPSPAAAPATSGSAVHLSLAQLGVEGANPFLDRGDPAAARAAKAARVKRRLDHALAQGLSDADVARGRGAGGPVLRSLQAAVYASTVPLNSSASFVFTIDSEGKLVSGMVGEASSDREAWARVARQTAQSFAARKLSVPKGRGVKLTVAVTSRLELPSGADPGKPDLSILPFPAAALTGDLTNIGARARRMVHAHVVSEEVL